MNTCKVYLFIMEKEQKEVDKSNKGLIDNLYNPFDDSNQFYNMLQISKRIKKIVNEVFGFLESKVETEVKVKVSLFKKLSKQHILAHIQFKLTSIKLDLSFVLTFNSSQLQPETAKSERKAFASNLLEDLFESFVSIEQSKLITSIEVLADSYFYSGNYLVVCLQKLIDYHHTSNVSLLGMIFKHEQLENLKQVYRNVPNFTIYLDLTSSLLSYLAEWIEEISSKQSQKVTINIFAFFSVQSIEVDDKQHCQHTLACSSIDLKITFLKVNLKPQNLQEEAFTKKSTHKICNFLAQKLVPDFLEGEFAEIFSRKDPDSNENQICLFKQIVLRYSKKQFALVNSFKLYMKHRLLQLKNTSDAPAYAILRRILVFNEGEESFWETNDKYLQMMVNNQNLPILEGKGFMRYFSNLYSDFTSIFTRKVTYEAIFKILVAKPIDDNHKKETVIPLKSLDINSVSKILSKISGNSLLFLPDLTIVSIGGFFKHLYDDKKMILPFNAVITVSPKMSKMKITTFLDSVLMTHYFSAAIYRPLRIGESSSKSEIYLTGGCSNSELISNFADTPIYKLEISKLEVEVTRLDLNTSKRNKLVFKHNIKLGEDLSYILVYGGFLCDTIVKGLNVGSYQNNMENLVVKPNLSQEVFELESTKWYILNNNQ